MGPGGDGGVRLRDGINVVPPPSEQPSATAQDQPVAKEGRPVARPVESPYGKIGLVNDGFGSFQPTPPDKPDKGRVFYGMIKWFTDGFMETIRETFSLFGLFKPVETMEVSRAVYYDEEITALDPDQTLNEEVLTEEATDVIEAGGLEAFVPQAVDSTVFYESAYCLL